MYLVLHINEIGYDYTWCKDINEVKECIDFWHGQVFNIYNMSNKHDIKYLFKEDFDRWDH